jgi:hypothetical protein
MWQSRFAYYAILSRARWKPTGWSDLLKDYEMELMELNDRDPIGLQTFLHMLAKTAKPGDIAAELPTLVAGKFGSLHWLAEKLVGGGDAPLRVMLRSDEILLTDGEASAPLEFPQAQGFGPDEICVWQSFVNQKAPRPESSPEKAKTKALAKLAAE